MDKKILFIFPKTAKEAPVSRRIFAFQKFYEQQGFKIESDHSPINFNTLLRLILKQKKVFITMPPFRGWLVLILPFIDFTLDIRDGWSVAMKSGYGGTSRKKKLKSFFAYLVEYYGLFFSNRIIVCTPGLEDYFKNNFPSFLTKKIILIPNGANKIKTQKTTLDLQGRSLNFICAGKFSEYGKDKVHKALQTIEKRYPGYKHSVKIIGASKEHNSWLKNTSYNLNIELLDKCSHIKLEEHLLTSDIGISIVRDPAYDLGTKAYEYIAHDLPILNYFEKENSFTFFFKDYMDSSFSPERDSSKFTREYFLIREKKFLIP